MRIWFLKTMLSPGHEGRITGVVMMRLNQDNLKNLAQNYIKKVMTLRISLLILSSQPNDL
jgi:hypothetical protein